ncbi:MAG: disulfide oxidoreductase, partial [Actinomycetota bacterium]
RSRLTGGVGMTTETMSLFFGLLTVAANLAVLSLVVLAVSARRSQRAADLLADVRALLSEHGLTFAWAVAAVATLGSLYYSEIAHFVPCKLCWYQRIAMYPLAITLGIAAWRRDLAFRVYALPVVAVGATISIYHYLQQRFPDLASSSCDPTAPCTLTWVWQFHYISIPFMALSAFALIATLLALIPKTGITTARSDEPAIDELERSLV